MVVIVKNKKKEKVVIFGLLKLTKVGTSCVQDTEFGLGLSLFHPTQYFFLLKKQSLDEVQLRQQEYVYIFFWLYQDAVN